MYHTTKITLEKIDTKVIAEKMINKMLVRLNQLKHRKNLTRSELTELKHLRAGASMLGECIKG